jgi:NADH:ubiquinone oxidoreductase subunit F (NADH-binding)
VYEKVLEKSEVDKLEEYCKEKDYEDIQKYMKNYKDKIVQFLYISGLIISSYVSSFSIKIKYIHHIHY